MTPGAANRPPELEEYRSYSHYWEKLLSHMLPVLPWIGVAFGAGYYFGTGRWPW